MFRALLVGTGLLLAGLPPMALKSEAKDGPEAATAEGKGRVDFKCVGDQSRIPPIYRLEPHEFNFEMRRKHDFENLGIEVHDVRFPSPVQSQHPENNTVHAEYYVPKGKGPFPAVIVLDILAGDAKVTRLQSTLLSQNGVAALFVNMAYYGPRRPAKPRVRMITPDLDHSLAAVRQTVLDIRRAAAWLEARPEVDARRLGIMGTSLGSFIGALSAEMEPRFRRVALMLGGGGLVDAFYEHPQAAVYRRAFEAIGGSKEKLKLLLAPVDPITCAENLKDRELLIIAAKRDDIVPPKATEALWLAAGKPKIVWYDCTHTGAVLFLLPACKELLAHFGAP